MTLTELEGAESVWAEMAASAVRNLLIAMDNGYLSEALAVLDYRLRFKKKRGAGLQGGFSGSYQVDDLREDCAFFLGQQWNQCLNALGLPDMGHEDRIAWLKQRHAERQAEKKGGGRRRKRGEVVDFELETVQRLARDPEMTPSSWAVLMGLRILSAQADNQPFNATFKEVGEACGVGRGVVYKVLPVLQRIGALRHKPAPRGGEFKLLV